jgi:hypothetical protein
VYCMADGLLFDFLFDVTIGANFVGLVGGATLVFLAVALTALGFLMDVDLFVP